ncbi:reverse transcriptase domain-containing protein [Tanacetum coccineum]
MHRDARDMILKCKDCQVHRPVPRNPQQPLTPIPSPWPFYKWGIDIAGPFPEGPGKVKFLIVAMDYFTKWIEAKAVATISGGQVKKFVWDNIMCHFGLPGEIVSDNGKQFGDNPFKDWWEKLNITQRFASVKHPQSNGLVERANRSLGEGIKARLGEGNKNWIEEIPHGLWAHRTLIKSSNGDTPFSLTYGMEAVVPAEIRMPTYRTAVMDVVHNDDEIRLNLDLLEEIRKRAAIREAKAKSKMTRYYNARESLITSLWPFYKWRIDIAGPFPEGPGKVKFLIVAIDYFTKWIEAKAVATISGGQVKKFVWDNIVCLFGLLGEIVSDNGKQFSDNPFKDRCEKLNITQRFASVKHPQSNGLVEKAWTKMGRTLRGHGSTRRWSVQAKVYGRSGPSADVEHCQPQEMLSLSHGSRMDWVRD